MHWVGTQDGGLDAERELILTEQTPADIIFLSAADSDLAAVASQWGPLFGSRLRLSHAAPLRQPVAADHFVQTVVAGSRIFIARLLGGRSYFPHLLQALADLGESAPRPQLLLISATEELDEDLIRLNDVGAGLSSLFYRLFAEGGAANLLSAGECIQRLLDEQSGASLELPRVVPMPAWGWYKIAAPAPGKQQVWLTFYRALYQTGDLDVIDALVTSLESKGLLVSAFYCHSLKENEVQEALLGRAKTLGYPDLILTLQSFAVGGAGGSKEGFPSAFGCPVLQVPVSATSQATWLKNTAGLSPSEATIQVALPEIDGRVLATVVGFKEDSIRLQDSEYTLKRLRHQPVQVAFVAQLAENWVRLRALENAHKRVAIILANYPNRDGRIGNGVGLDTPASVIEILRALAAEGYDVPNIPENGDTLMQRLLAGVTNDAQGSFGKDSAQSLPHTDLQSTLEHWPIQRREEIQRHWPESLPEQISVAGIRFGNVFIGIQPPRGFSLQTQSVYHSPDLPPPPQYIAFYQWLRTHFKTDAVVHLGKHGNLEWLPGRAVALGEDDYPQLCLGPTPHLYPFIVNNPGEGTQAKRRTAAVIIDHLTPPLTRAGLYGQLEQLERLLEEHTHCLALYPRRASELEAEMKKLLAEAPWRTDLPDGGSSLPSIANFLCELKESQIRSGLHIFGTPPTGDRAVDFILSLVRLPSAGRASLFSALSPALENIAEQPPTVRDALDVEARNWIVSAISGAAVSSESPALAALRTFVQTTLLPLLAKTRNELCHLIDGLSGRFIPPGPAGAPTRGRVDVLPTGRNFFALDPRVVPTPTAWRCGKALAESLLKRHFQDHGESLRTLALVVWGTSNMRTGGDDLAQALWLWGCEPVWEENSGRVIDFKILPASLLGRPRVDITLRVSGLFRDAFGDTVRLLAAIPKRLALLDEPGELNPVREAWLRDQTELIARGVSAENASRTAALRVFTSGPGCYGTGLLQVIDAGNWETKEDLAAVFLRWGDHAAGADGNLTPEPEALRTRLSVIQAIAQNQDNREHDILDSDDYFQFQGGLQAAIESLRGAAPANYHGDSSDPGSPRIRSLEEELVRVLHSRALNPRWIEAMEQHGYKGAFEIAATIDYLFGYSATTGLVRDHHFEAAAKTLVLEQEAFFREHNPDALREASERLLEAAQRGLWSSPNAATIDDLETLLLSLEGERE